MTQKVWMLCIDPGYGEAPYVYLCASKQAGRDFLEKFAREELGEDGRGDFAFWDDMTQDEVIRIAFEGGEDEGHTFTLEEEEVIGS